jgi:hypothetical protein
MKLNIQQLASGKVFPKQHAEHGRSCRVLPCRVSQVYTRIAGIAGHQKLAAVPSGSDIQYYFIRLGLENLFYPSTGKKLIKLIDDTFRNNTVKRQFKHSQP